MNLRAIRLEFDGDGQPYLPSDRRWLVLTLIAIAFALLAWFEIAVLTPISGRPLMAMTGGIGLAAIFAGGFRLAPLIMAATCAFLSWGGLDWGDAMVVSALTTAESAFAASLLRRQDIFRGDFARLRQLEVFTIHGVLLPGIPATLARVAALWVLDGVDSFEPWSTIELLWFGSCWGRLLAGIVILVWLAPQTRRKNKVEVGRWVLMTVGLVVSSWIVLSRAATGVDTSTAFVVFPFLGLLAWHGTVRQVATTCFGLALVTLAVVGDKTTGIALWDGLFVVTTTGFGVVLCASLTELEYSRRRLRENGDRIQLLNGIVSLAAQAREFPELTRAAVEELASFFPERIAYHVVVLSGGQVGETVLYGHDGIRLGQMKPDILPRNGPFLESVRAGKVLLIRDTRVDPRSSFFFEDDSAEHCRSLVQVPFRLPLGSSAALGLASSRAGEWTDHEMSTLRECAGVLASAAKRIEEERLRVVAENELSLHRDHLEDLVKARTKELERAQLELLRKEKLATLGHLIATVSHELRNPLGTIQNSISVIEAMADPDDMSERALARIKRSIRRCDLIIEELLQFTRQQPPKCQRHRLDIWLDKTLDDDEVFENVVRDETLNRKVTVDFDSERILRCLLNLVQNATQAMSEAEVAEPRIRLSTRVEGRFVGICVSDNGPGIPTELARRVFEPLYSTKSFGVGLGLSVVSQILEQHGGSVVAEETPGGGATMVMWLPLAEGAEPEAFVES